MELIMIACLIVLIILQSVAVTKAYLRSQNVTHDPFSNHADSDDWSTEAMILGGLVVFLAVVIIF